MHPLLILSLKIAKVKFLGVKLSNLIRQHSIDGHVAILPTVFKDKLPKDKHQLIHLLWILMLIW